MSDITFASAGDGAPEIAYYPVAASQTIKAGDIVVLKADGTVRIATNTEATATTGERFGTHGILGFAAHAITTDANGRATGVLYPSNVDPNAVPVTPVPQYAMGVDGSPSTRSLLGVFLATEESEFRARVTNNGGNYTVTESIIGAQFGFRIASGNVVELDSNNANNKIAVITAIDKDQPTYGTASTRTFVRFRIVPTASQVRVGTRYTA